MTFRCQDTETVEKSSIMNLIFFLDTLALILTFYWLNIIYMTFVHCYRSVSLEM